MESLDVTKYPCPSNVNVANFVTKAKDFYDDYDSFTIWKKQMMCLLESQGIAVFINRKTLPPKKDEDGSWRRTDKLVQGWILGSIGRNALRVVLEEKTAKDMWLRLEANFGPKKDNGNIPRPNKSPEESKLNLKLYKAARKGEWNDAVKDLFLRHIHGEAILNPSAETALHVAVMSENATPFVREVVKLTPPEKLARKDSYGDTALHCAAIAGNFEAVKALVGKNPNLPYILNEEEDELPVLRAAIAGKREPLEYLISASEDTGRGVRPFHGRLGLILLCEVIGAELFDVALKLVEKYPHLAGLRSDYDEEDEEDEENDGDCNVNIVCALSAMAKRRSAFRSGENFNWYQSFIYHCLLSKKPKRKDVLEKGSSNDVESKSNHASSRNNDYSGSWLKVKLECLIWEAIKRIVPQAENMMERMQVHERASELVEKLCEEMIEMSEKRVRCAFLDSILVATENGISEIVEKIIEAYPSVVFSQDHKGRHMFQLAAKNRYENVFNIIYGLRDVKSELFDVLDVKGNNLMHICGKLAPPHRLNLVPGAALQMQRELQWFKEIENFVHPSRRTQRNSKDQTPQMVFTKKHKHLKLAGEKWMKTTATSCNIAATLIATVVFAAAFSLPSGGATM